MKISLLLTGNELMSGDTVDTNSAYMAQSLKDLSLVPYVKKVVGDDQALLVSSIQELAVVSDVLIVNGGLGPTVDDLTAEALSQAIDSPLVRNEQAYIKLSEWAEKRGFTLTKSNLKQTQLPEVCQIVDNPHGSAVGFSCLFEGCLIICTPGVPSEFKPMVENHLLALIRAHGAIEETSLITRLRLFGISESGLQDMVDDVFPEWPDNVELGFRVQLPILEVKIATVGEAHQALNQQWAEKFRQHFSDYIIGTDNVSLSQAFNQVLREHKKTITIAESCTGGLIASNLVSEAGSSQVFQAGFVAYSNQVKAKVLGVSEQTLIDHGAVSEQVVKEMAEGALRISGADLALSISGVAGPGGGTEEKPVGTVWIAWGAKGDIKARRFFLPFGRVSFQRAAAALAMDIARRAVLGISTDIHYFNELKRA